MNIGMEGDRDEVSIAFWCRGWVRHFSGRCLSIHAALLFDDSSWRRGSCVAQLETSSRAPSESTSSRAPSD